MPKIDFEDAALDDDVDVDGDLLGEYDPELSTSL